MQLNEERPGVLKQFVARLLRWLPPVPTPLWDGFLSYRLGSTPPAVPQVDYVAGPGMRAQRLPLAELPPPASGRLRVAIISDTHERHRQVALPEADVLLHCGDILMSSRLASQQRGERVLGDFNEWLAGTPCRERVVVGGNHDVALERLGARVAQELLSSATLLQDSCTVLPLARLKVYGNAYSEGTSRNQAWQEDEPQVSGACDDADIVLTHERSTAIQAAVLERCKPLLWASGHVHQEHGAHWSAGVLFVNAAIHDVSYRPVQPPIVVDLVRAKRQ